MSYLDEVVRFIQTNTEGVQLGATSEEYSDPFTGKLACISKIDVA